MYLTQILFISLKNRNIATWLPSRRMHNLRTPRSCLPHHRRSCHSPCTLFSNGDSTISVSSISCHFFMVIAEHLPVDLLAIQEYGFCLLQVALILMHAINILLAVRHIWVLAPQCSDLSQTPRSLDQTGIHDRN